MNPTPETFNPTPTPDIGIAARLTAAAAHIRPQWFQTADFYPQDSDIIDAWSIARAHCADDRAAAMQHLDRFVSNHRTALDDLVWRARYRAGPTPLLEDIARTLETVLEWPTVGGTLP